MILNVARTDKGYQLVNGGIRLVPDGQTLWVREQGIQQPVFFYTRQGSLPFELVFTRVTDAGAVGYILMPDEKGLQAEEMTSDDNWSAALAEKPIKDIGLQSSR